MLTAQRLALELSCEEKRDEALDGEGPGAPAITAVWRAARCDGGGPAPLTVSDAVARLS